MTNLLRKKSSSDIDRYKHPLLAMQNLLSKAMEDFYNNFEIPSFPTTEFENQAISPAIDIVDNKDHFKVEAEMPGMGEEDISVDINNGILTIKGEKETSKQDKDKNYLMREITYGSYERNIRLPDFVDIDKAKASFKKGMLWIDIPKLPEATKQSRKLEVTKS